MRIEKAIKVLEEVRKRGSMISDEDDDDALKLGIEALKYRQQIGECWPVPPLLGETKD